MEATQVLESRQLQISGNLFNKNGNDIKLVGSAAAPGLINNVFVEGNTTDRPLYSFLIVDSVVDTVVTGNRIADVSAVEGTEPLARYPAIRVTGTAEDTVLYDNVQTTRQWPAKYGLQVDGQTTDTAIGENVFRGLQGAVHIANGATLAASHSQEPVSRAKETGVMGLRFWADTGGRAGAVNVTFRMKRQTVPVLHQTLLISTA